MKSENIIFDLFQFRNNTSTSKEKDYYPCLAYLNTFPTIEKQKLIKISASWKKNIKLGELIELLPIQITFDEDMIQKMLYSEIAERNDSDVYSILFQFCTIGWYKSFFMFSNDEELKSKILLILKKCRNQTYHVQNAYFFEIICQKYFKPNGANTDPNFIDHTLELIEENIFPNSSFYQTCILVFKSISNSRQTQQINNMISLIDKMITNKAPVLMVSDYSPLVVLLQQKISTLDTTAFSTICRITNLEKNSFIKDSFVLVSSVFFSFALRNTQVSNLAQKEKEYEQEAKQQQSIVENDLYIKTLQTQQPEGLVSECQEEETEVDKKANELGKILKLATQESQITFLESVLFLLSTVSIPEYIIVIFNSFLTMVNIIESAELLKALLPKVMKCSVMNPTKNIFEENLIPELSLLRKHLLITIKNISPKAISYTIDPKYPLLTIENITRATSLGFKFDVFINDISYAICSSIVFLYTLTKNRSTIKAKAIAFMFLVNMLSDENAFLYVLSSESIMSAYAHHFFEKDSARIAFCILRNALSKINKNVFIPSTSDAIFEASMLINTPGDSELHDEVCEYLADCLENGVSDAIARQFEKCVIPLLKHLTEKPSHPVFIHMLRFINKIIKYNPDYLKNQEISRMLVTITRKLNEDELKSDIITGLLSILAGGIAMQMFLIRTPSIIPTIVASYGDTPMFVKILKVFSKLALSDFNTRALHDGDLDLILMKYINSGKKEFTHNTLKMNIVLSKKEFNKIAVPLLITIFRSKSSNAVAANVSDHLAKNGFFSETLLHELRYESLIPSQRIPLGTDPVPLSAGPIPVDALNEGFTVEFMHKIDGIALHAAKGEIRFFTLKGKDKEISMSLCNGTIIATYYDVQLGKKVVVTVIRKIPDMKWDKMILGFDMKKSPVKIYTYFDDLWRNDSELSVFSLTSDMNLIIGGGQEDYTYAFISQVTLYKGAKSPSTNGYGEKIYSTSALSFTKLGVAQQGQITTNVFPATATPKLLIDSIVRGYNSSIVASYFNNPTTIENTLFIIEVLKMILEQPSFVQKTFVSTQLIAHSLSSHPDILDYRIYIACYRTFDGIRPGNLRKEWFEKIVFNTWIWIKCKAEDFKNILIHWSTTILSSAEDILISKPFFRMFLNQYIIIFQHDEINAAYNYQCSYTKEEMDTISEQFLLFMKRLTLVHLSKEDISSIFIHLSTCKSKESIMGILGLTLDISNSIKKVREYSTSMIEPLNTFLQSDQIDIVNLTLKVIHNLAMDEITKYIQCAIMIIHRNIDQAALYQKLLDEINEYQNLLPLVLILNIKLKQNADIVATIMEQWTYDQKNIATPPFWFTWYIIFALENPKTEEKVASLVAYLLTISPKRNEDIHTISFFCRFLQHETLYSAERLIEKILIKLSNHEEMIINETFRENIGKVSFYLSMLAFSPPKMSDNFIRALEDSPFRASKFFLPRHTIFQQTITDIAHLEHLIYFDISSIIIGAFVDLDENMEWKKRVIGEICLKFLKDQRYIGYIKMIINRDVLLEKNINELSGNSLAFFDEEIMKYKDMFHDSFGQFISSYRKIFEEMKQMIANIPSFELNESKSQAELKNESIKKNIKQENELLQRKRDRTICSNYCAYKMKTRKGLRTGQPRPNAKESIYEQNCKLIRTKGDREARIAVYRDSIFITGKNFVKAFSMPMIKIILKRRRAKQENAIEFFISDGKTYLVDLDKTQSTNFINLVKKYIGPNSKTFIQLTSSADLFATFTFTNEWTRGILSNFDYLMKLNIFSGRSFNDPNIYPIFPSIIENYETGKVKNFSNTKFEKPSLERINLNKAVTKTLEDEVVTNRYIAPEFFFLPAVVADNDRLPEWATNKYEFVYKHRKILESEEVRNYLPAFINNVWGIKMVTKDHNQIFNKPHEMFNPNKDTQLQRMNMKLEINATIICAISLKTKSPYSYDVLLFCNDGCVYDCAFTVEKEFKIKKCEECLKLDIDESSTFSYSPKGIVCLSTIKRKAVVLSKTKIVAEHTLFAEKSLIAYCDSAFVYCPDSCSVAYSVDRLSMLMPANLLHTKCRISHLAANVQFKILCIACEDGTVEVHSLKDGRLVGGVNIGDQPMHLIITQSLGFVICCSNSTIVVMNIDGDEIKRCKLSSPIASLFTFKDDSDFDYVCGEDRNGKFIVFEALYPEKAEKITLMSNIVFSTYSTQRKAFISIDRDANVFISPYNLK